LCLGLPSRPLGRGNWYRITFPVFSAALGVDGRITLNIKWIFKKLIGGRGDGGVGIDWIDLTEDRDCCERDNKHFVSRKFGEILDYLRNS